MTDFNTPNVLTPSVVATSGPSGAAIAPTVVTTAVSWYRPTSSRWVAYRGSTRIGSVDHVGAFIATNRHRDVLGAYAELAGAVVLLSSAR